MKGALFTMSKTSRTTIMMNDVLLERVNTHVKQTGDSMTTFYNRAIINQLENEGDWEIRDLVSKDSNKPE